jgi:hypothetical protein
MTNTHKKRYLVIYDYCCASRQKKEQFSMLLMFLNANAAASLSLANASSTRTIDVLFYIGR